MKVNLSENNTVFAKYAFRDPIKGSKFVDPDNLSTTADYYLLENLAIGLVRDDQKSLSGYESAIAKEWKQTDDKTWEFIIRDNLKWSDGSELSLEFISDFFNYKRQHGSRHVSILKSTKSITIDSSKRVLKFIFLNPVDNYFLHELSLSDLALHELSDDWKKFSGAYFVEKFDLTKGHLFLKKNLNFVKLSNESPKEVILSRGGKIENIAEMLKDNKIDFVTTNAYKYLPDLSLLYSVAPKIFEGASVNLFIAYFTKNKFTKWSFEQKYKLSKILELATPVGEDFNIETQLVPKGFSGRISFEEKKSNFDFDIESVQIDKKVTIKLWPVIYNFTNYVERIKSVLQKSNIEYEIISSADESSSAIDADIEFTVFTGNQRDFCSSLVFMFDSDKGPMSYIRSNYKEIFDQLSNVSYRESRVKICDKIHSEVLKSKNVIPLFTTKTHFLTSSRISIENFNPFDMRPRFYDFRIKN